MNSEALALLHDHLLTALATPPQKPVGYSTGAGDAGRDWSS